eukprot:m.328862 g.328862  ORF g.328862 m.328862 type:complete len:716 (-) comp57223_c0_seq1:285-2432(-)
MTTGTQKLRFGRPARVELGGVAKSDGILAAECAGGGAVQFHGGLDGVKPERVVGGQRLGGGLVAFTVGHGAGEKLPVRARQHAPSVGKAREEEGLGAAAQHGQIGAVRLARGGLRRVAVSGHQHPSGVQNVSKQHFVGPAVLWACPEAGHLGNDVGDLRGLGLGRKDNVGKHNGRGDGGLWLRQALGEQRLEQVIGFSLGRRVAFLGNVADPLAVLHRVVGENGGQRLGVRVERGRERHILRQQVGKRAGEAAAQLLRAGILQKAVGVAQRSQQAAQHLAPQRLLGLTQAVGLELLPQAHAGVVAQHRAGPSPGPGAQAKAPRQHAHDAALHATAHSHRGHDVAWGSRQGQVGQQNVQCHLEAGRAGLRDKQICRAVWVEARVAYSRHRDRAGQAQTQRRLRWRGPERRLHHAHQTRGEQRAGLVGGVQPAAAVKNAAQVAGVLCIPVCHQHRELGRGKGLPLRRLQQQLEVLQLGLGLRVLHHVRHLAVLVGADWLVVREKRLGHSDRADPLLAVGQAQQHVAAGQQRAVQRLGQLHVGKEVGKIQNAQRQLDTWMAPPHGQQHFALGQAQGAGRRQLARAFRAPPCTLVHKAVPRREVASWTEAGACGGRSEEKMACVVQTAADSAPADPEGDAEQGLLVWRLGSGSVFALEGWAGGGQIALLCEGHCAAAEVNVLVAHGRGVHAAGVVHKQPDGPGPAVALVDGQPSGQHLD